jgi:hypothetical protein
MITRNEFQIFVWTSLKARKGASGATIDTAYVMLTHAQCVANLRDTRRWQERKSLRTQGTRPLRLLHPLPALLRPRQTAHMVTVIQTTWFGQCQVTSDLVSKKNRLLVTNLDLLIITKQTAVNCYRYGNNVHLLSLEQKVRCYWSSIYYSLQSFARQFLPVCLELLYRQPPC